MSRPTMSDVAKLAGVSKATVSLVISGRATDGAIKISAQTRERVLSAAQQLGYNVNVIARSMSARRTRTFGLVTFMFSDHAPSVILPSAQETAHAHGYFMMVSSIEGDLGALYEQINRLDSWRVDGIFIAVAAGGDWYRQLQAQLQLHIPVVWLEGAALATDINSVGVDNLRGAQLAVEHLLALGHREIGMITGMRGWTATEQRAAGWRLALAQAGVDPSAAATAEGNWTVPSGYQAAGQLFEQNPKLTAILAHNDEMALGALRALRERGLRVPEDVSLVGYDDSARAPYAEPPLTTVRQDLAELGRLAVELLIEAGENPGLTRQIVITPELVVRGSSGPARLAQPAG